MNTTMNTNRRSSTAFYLGWILAATPAVALAQQAPSAATRLNELGPESQTIGQRVGLWDVAETHWARGRAAPVTPMGLVAERLMIGSLLQEFIRPPSDAAHKDVKRTDLLSFNRVEGRWKLRLVRHQGARRAHACLDLRLR